MRRIGKDLVSKNEELAKFKNCDEARIAAAVKSDFITYLEMAVLEVFQRAD